MKTEQIERLKVLCEADEKDALRGEERLELRLLTRLAGAAAADLATTSAHLRMSKEARRALEECGTVISEIANNTIDGLNRRLADSDADNAWLRALLGALLAEVAPEGTAGGPAVRVARETLSRRG